MYQVFVKIHAFKQNFKIFDFFKVSYIFLANYYLNMDFLRPALYQAYKPITSNEPRVGIKSTQEDLLALIQYMESKQTIETTAEKESAKTTIDNKKTFLGKL